MDEVKSLRRRAAHSISGRALGSRPAEMGGAEVDPLFRAEFVRASSAAIGGSDKANGRVYEVLGPRKRLFQINVVNMHALFVNSLHKLLVKIVY